MRHYYVLTADPRAHDVYDFIRDHKLVCSVHLNRTRFYVPEGSVLTEFLLRFGDTCTIVNPDVDLATGLPNRHD